MTPVPPHSHVTHPAKSVEQPPSPVYDPYAGMKTPGQRQLISLQERVKVGEITVDEAVNEFKAWKFDQDGRASSIRYQQVGQSSSVAEGNNESDNKSGG